MTALVVKSGSLAGRRLELGGLLTVGREDADLLLDDPKISRRHALFRPLERGVLVEDLGSRNGTWVNGIRIQAPTRLASGDVVALGAVSIEVESEELGRPLADAHGAFDPVRTPRSRAIASRSLTPALLSVTVVVATALALVLYFALR